jgi:hypothetical protein
MHIRRLFREPVDDNMANPKTAEALGLTRGPVAGLVGIEGVVSGPLQAAGSQRGPKPLFNFTHPVAATNNRPNDQAKEPPEYRPFEGCTG